MYNIQIGRFEEDPEAQGVVRPADDSWQLVIDKDGFPHLWVRCKLEDDGSGQPGTGMLAIDDVLQDDMDIRSLMESSFGGTLTAEETAEAETEFAERRAKSPVPCPR